MSKVDDRLDEAIQDLVVRVPGRVVAAIAFVLYPGAGLLLPLVLRWPVIWLVYANLLAVLFATILSLSWLLVQVETAKRRHLIEWTTNLRLLSSEEFEWLVGELYRRDAGWEQIRETGHQDRPDGNVDLRSIENGQRKIVQCKHWQSWLVGVDDIREFAGTLLRDGLPGSAGVFVTLSDFTEQARSEAATIGIALVNGRELYSRIEKARRPEPCPVCQAPMVFGLSSRGWWFRCVAPTCSGKHDLGRDPGHAVELLTELPAPTGRTRVTAD
jgi:hypothetical protein